MCQREFGACYSDAAWKPTVYVLGKLPDTGILVNPKSPETLTIISDSSLLNVGNLGQLPF